MADVVRLLPRLWDGQRALRFLAGLAMLALAFAANAGLIGPSALPAGSAQLTVPAQLTGSAPARTAATSASAEGVTLAGKAGVESAAGSEATTAASSKSTAAVSSEGTAVAGGAGTAAAGVSAVPGGHHGTVGLGVNPLVLAGLLGLMVVVVWAAGLGAGLFAGGMPARRGPPGR